MHTMTPRPLHLPSHRRWLLQGLLLLTLATMATGRTQAQELVLAEDRAAAPLATEPAAAPTQRLTLPDRVGLLLDRLGQRVLKLAPWNMPAVVAPAEVPAAESALSDLPGELRTQWELKAIPEPLVALVQLSRPTLRLSSDAEVSLRLVGGVGVMLKSRF